MTAHGPNGACPTGRRSRPAPPDPRTLYRLRTVIVGWAKGSAGCGGTLAAKRARLRRWAARRAFWRSLMTFWSGFSLVAFAGGCASMVTAGPPRVAIFVERRSASGEAWTLICSDAAGATSFVG